MKGKRELSTTLSWKTMDSTSVKSMEGGPLSRSFVFGFKPHHHSLHTGQRMSWNVKLGASNVFHARSVPFSRLCVLYFYCLYSTATSTQQQQCNSNALAMQFLHLIHLIFLHTFLQHNKPPGYQLLQAESSGTSGTRNGK